MKKKPLILRLIHSVIGEPKPYWTRIPEKKRKEATEWARQYYDQDEAINAAQRFVVVLSEVVCVPISQLTPSTRFLEDLKMDDLEPVEVLMAVEVEFGIEEIPQSDAQKIFSIGETIDYLQKLPVHVVRTSRTENR